MVHGHHDHAMKHHHPGAIHPAAHIELPPEVAEAANKRMEIDPENPGAVDAVVCGHREQTVFVWVLAFVVVVAIIVGVTVSIVKPR